MFRGDGFSISGRRKHGKRGRRQESDHCDIFKPTIDDFNQIIFNIPEFTAQIADECDNKDYNCLNEKTNEIFQNTLKKCSNQWLNE